MNLATMLEMAVDAAGDRIAVGSVHGGGLTYAELLAKARAAAGLLTAKAAERFVAVDLNSEAVPVGLFAAAMASIPYVPVNYRLADDQLRAILERAAPAVAVVDASIPPRLGDPVRGLELLLRDELLEAEAREGVDVGFTDPEEVAVLLFTSGTTGEPKAAVLRHRHLTSYILGSIDFLAADPDDAALVSVPPYHIAGLAAVLSSVWSGRRIVYLPQFDSETWVKVARQEAITHAMVVPTMLGRILDVLEREGEGLPALRHLSYGGGRMPAPVVERAMRALPDVGFVNAYGLTETSSTIAVLTPDDHREAFASDDPAIRARLGSVGRPIPTLEVEIRDGEVWVRGEQVSGEYLDRGSQLTADGWFRTNDGGRIDADGFLYIEGRLDDVIVRGGENLSPGEIEDCLVAHPVVADAAVVGVPDVEWGEAVAAFVVPEAGADVTVGDLQAWVRERLKSTRCPERVEFRSELPYSETGKLLRRVLKAELSGN